MTDRGSTRPGPVRLTENSLSRFPTRRARIRHRGTVGRAAAGEP